MINITKELKNKYCISALRVDMAADVVSEEELNFMKNLSLDICAGLTVKVGGCDAITDIYNAKEYGATSLIAPMIESEYALHKFIDSCNQVYENKLNRIDLYINIETLAAYNNLDLILSSPNLQYIKGIVLGRDDMAKSSDIALNDINSKTMLNIAQNISDKTYKYNKEFIIGGCIRPNAIPFLKQININQIARYETRRVVFDISALTKNNAEEGIYKAIEFEIECLEQVGHLNNKHSSISKKRIENLKTYLN